MNRCHVMHFPRDHPTAAGHFPGNPVIPGALLLDEVLLAIAAGEGRMAGACTIRSAKFLRPVRPGDSLLIRWQPDMAGAMRFECLLLEPERLAASGTVQLDVVAP